MKNLTTATAVTSQRPAGSGRPRRPARTATSCRPPCPPASPTVQQPAAVQQHLLGQPGRHPRRAPRSPASASPATPRRSTTGTSASPTAPACSRRRTRSSSRTRARTRTRRARPTARPTPRSSSRTTCRCRSRPGGRTRPSSTRPLSRSRRPPNLLGDYHLQSRCPARPRRPATSARPSLGGVGHADARDIDDEARPARRWLRRRRRRVRRLGSRPATAGGPAFYFSTAGNTNPPGVAGTADDADVYRWDGTAYSRQLDLSAAPYGRARRRQRRRLRPGRRHALLRVVRRRHHPARASERCRTRTSSTGTATHLVGVLRRHRPRPDGRQPRRRRDQRRRARRSTSRPSATTNPPGVGGTADDADVYSWNGTAYARVVDATASRRAGRRPTSTASSGSTPRTATSPSAPTPRPCRASGRSQDEDVVAFSNGTWSVYFDGTAHGLTTSDLDIDAFTVAATRPHGQRRDHRHHYDHSVAHPRFADRWPVH